MPIFQDPDRQRFYDLWSDDRRAHDHQHHQDRENRPWDHEPSWKNGFGYGEFECESSDPEGRDFGYSRVPGPQLPKLHTSDRGELIQHLKRSETSAWMQGRLVYSALIVPLSGLVFANRTIGGQLK